MMANPLTLRRVFVSMVIVGALAVSQEARAQEQSSGTIPPCGAEKLKEWSRIKKRSDGSLGIVVPEMDSSRLGSVDHSPVRATDTVHDWTPKDILKQTVCGTLDHAGFFHTITAEYDWDNYIDPWHIDRYGIFAEHPNAQPCQRHPTHTCISAEVTPPAKLRRNNQWWNWDTQSSALIGRSVCVYGPWVGDGGHGDRPEIHPSEVIWWREKELDGLLDKDADRVPFYILLVQDASARYAHRSQYVLEGTAPPKWEPWVAKELKHTFVLPFLRQRDDKEPVKFEVQADGHGARPRADKSTAVGLKGIAETTVYGELGAGVAASVDVCNRPNGDVQGLLSIDASVSLPVCETCEAEGFAAIRVTRSGESIAGRSTDIADPKNVGSRFRLGVEHLATFMEAEPTGPAVPVTESQVKEVWPLLLRALGHSGPSPLAPKLVRVPGWRLTVRPRAGEDPAGFSVRWQVKERPPAGRGGVEVVRTLVGNEQDHLKGAEITLEFPHDREVAEVVVKADVTDDRQIKASSIVWHGFSHGAQSVDRNVADVENLLTVAASLAAVDPQRFLLLTGKPQESGETDPIAAVVGRRARSTLYDIGKGDVISLEDIHWLACEAKKSQLPKIPFCSDDEIEHQRTRSWNGPLPVDDCCIARLTTFRKAH